MGAGNSAGSVWSPLIPVVGEERLKSVDEVLLDRLSNGSALVAGQERCDVQLGEDTVRHSHSQRGAELDNHDILYSQGSRTPSDFGQVSPCVEVSASLVGSLWICAGKWVQMWNMKNAYYVHDPKDKYCACTHVVLLNTYTQPSVIISLHLSLILQNHEIL